MLYTPGPTEMAEEIRKIGSYPLPYFRSTEYCSHVIELTEDLRYLFQTENTPLTITASGTAGMEMALVNLFNPSDQVVFINGGTFGAKWGQLARSLGLETIEVVCGHGKDLSLSSMLEAIPTHTKGLLLTAHETSTGQRYDIKEISRALENQDIFVVVDGVSSIGSDPFKMDEWGIDCAISCSQKGLACMPGLVFVAFSDRARYRLQHTRHYRGYLDARIYFDNIGRGMLPYTPAIHATFQVARKLKIIKDMGIEGYVNQHLLRAKAFRHEMTSECMFSIFPESPSNAISAMNLPLGVSAHSLIEMMRIKYNAVLPLNPTKSDRFIRVSHMGEQSVDDIVQLAKWLRYESNNLLRDAV